MESITTYINDILNTATSTHLTAANASIRLLVSILFGMVVGYERKRKGQIAGIRTFALMSMGACLAMLLSIYVPQEYLGLKNGDPGRIAAQVVTGVGFIGAGAIIQMKGSVRGLTTAAGVWITAIIGMAVGVGMYWSAFFATLLCVTILVLFEWMGQTHHIGQEAKVINLLVEAIVTDITPYRNYLESHNVHLTTFYVNYNYEAEQTELNLVVLVPTGDNLLNILDELRRIQPTTTMTLTSQLDI